MYNYKQRKVGITKLRKFLNEFWGSNSSRTLATDKFHEFTNGTEEMLIFYLVNKLTITFWNIFTYTSSLATAH